jgi:hypothetical protein
MCYIRLENCEPFRNFINQPAFVDTRHHTLRLGERTEEFFASWFVPADWCTFIWQQCRIDFLLKFAASSKWLTYTRTECQGPKTKGHYQWQSEFPTFHLLPCCCRRSHRIGAGHLCLVLPPGLQAALVNQVYHVQHMFQKCPMLRHAKTICGTILKQKSSSCFWWFAHGRWVFSMVFLLPCSTPIQIIQQIKSN